MRRMRGEKVHPAKELFDGKKISILGLCSLLRRIESNWVGLVGDALARRSSPKQFEFSEKGGILHIMVSNSAALQDMHFKKNSILRSIERFTSLPLVDLQIKMGSITPTREIVGNPERKRERLSLDDRQVEEAARELSYEITDPALAHVMARFRLLCEKRAR